MALVTLEEARAQIKSDTLADDPWLNTWIPIVEWSVRAWLKDEWRLYEPSGLLDSQGDPIPLEDSNGPVVAPRVKGAILVELAQQRRFLDGAEAPAVPSHWGYGYSLGAGATSLLATLRKSTVA